jgi:tetratricopeptide (TPR) repeat protein
MKSMTAEEARQYCTQPSVGLAVDEHDFLYYEAPEEHSFFIKHPPEHRRIVALTYDILTVTPLNNFYGGLIWLYGWHLGVNELVRPGWRILEDMRRAHGDPRSLDLAPAQCFRNDEFVELHACLLQVVAYGWPACFLPSGSEFFVEFRSSERAFFYLKEPKMLDELYSKLGSWGPEKEDPLAAHALSITHYEVAQKRMAEGNVPGAIELFRLSLRADPDFYDAAYGLIGALKDIGQLDEAISIAKRLAQFVPEEALAQSTLSALCERKAILAEADAKLARPGS